MNIWEALERHDLDQLPPDLLRQFKALCAYQLAGQPDHELVPVFRRISSTDALTYGEAALIAPFMLNP